MVVLVLISCGKKESKIESGITENFELTFRTDSLVKKSCVGENCAKLRLVWPIAAGEEVTINYNGTWNDESKVWFDVVG